MEFDHTLATLQAAKLKVRAAFDRASFRPTAKEAVVVSASHAVRWREAHLRENAPVPGLVTRFFGAGGLPLWNADFVAAVATPPAHVRKIVLQQDFRFGNGFLKGVADATHIDRQLINPLGDRLCKTRGDLAIGRIMAVENTLFVPWSLIGLRSGWRAGAKSVARHPHWNVEEYFGSASAWESLFAAATGDGASGADERFTLVRALFCDGELHPSPFGCLWLSLVADGRRADEALAEAQAEFARILPGFAPLAPPLGVLADGAVATLPRALRGVGFLAATGLRLLDATTGSGDDRARAAQIERDWTDLAADVLDARVKDLPRLRAEGHVGTATFLDHVNPLIDIGTDRTPSLIGLVWLLDNHDRLDPLAAQIRGFLASLRSSRSG